jgi:hypothetical protein
MQSEKDLNDVSLFAKEWDYPATGSPALSTGSSMVTIRLHDIQGHSRVFLASARHAIQKRL